MDVDGLLGMFELYSNAFLCTVPEGYRRNELLLFINTSRDTVSLQSSESDSWDNKMSRLRNVDI